MNKASVYVSSCHLYLELVFFFLKAGNEEVPYSELRTILQKQALSCLPCQLKFKKTKKIKQTNKKTRGNYTYLLFVYWDVKLLCI